MSENFEFLKYIKNFIIEQIPNPSQYEIDLKNFIKKKIPSKTLKVVRVLVYIFAIYFFILLTKTGFHSIRYIILSLVGLLAIIITNYFKKQQNKAKMLLKRAINNIKKNDISKATDNLLDAYDCYENPTLRHIINNFTQTYKPNYEQDMRVMEMNLQDETQPISKDKKLQEIVNQQKNVAEYIVKHKKVIVKSNKKIDKLKDNITTTNNKRLKNEYNNLINRYKDIIELEDSKLNFYMKAKEELLELKENHIITQKLLLEEQELRNLEDELLEKSIVESYDTEISDFINYETSYLEAINKYSGEISSSTNQNIFEDVIKEFETKTKIL